MRVAFGAGRGGGFDGHLENGGLEYSLLCPVGDIRNPKYGQLEINVCGDSVEIKIIHLFH